MNKTLLLILVDFLLLTILSLTKWDEERQDQSKPSDAQPQSVSTMAMMEKDLLDTLTSSLEEERAQQEALSDEAKAKAAALAAAQEALAKREADLETAAEREARLKAEREALQSKVAQTETAAESLKTQYDELAIKARQTEAQSRLLQQELDQKQRDLADKAAALADAETKQATAQKEIQNLNIVVRVAEEEKKYLLQNVDTLKETVALEREEKQRIQEQTGKLAAGVTQLAENSADLKQTIRNNTPINANQLFADFGASQSFARFYADRFTRGKVIEDREQSIIVFVSDGTDIYALSHVDKSPLGMNRSPSEIRQIRIEIGRSEKGMTPELLSFLALDPRIMALPISQEQVATLGGKVYYTALEPFKFPEAVLIDAQGSRYGEVEFKLDPATPGYVKMQSKIFNRLFGEFSPSAGDMVLSKTGELLGVMVDRNYCVLVRNLIPRETLPLGKTFEGSELTTAIASLKNRYDRLPATLR